MTKRKLIKGIRRLYYLPRGFDFFRYIRNKFLHFYLKLIKSTRVAYPSTILLEVTNLCNLKCITCPREYRFGDEMDKGFIDITCLKKVIDEAYPYIDSIGLTGLGETFLYDGLTEAVEYINQKSKGIITFVSINAHLKNSVAIAEQIADSIDTIQISMDGIGAVYEQVRIKGNYSFFSNNVKRIIALTKNKRADVMLNMVVLKENYLQMADVVQFAHDQGVKYLNINTFNIVASPDIDVSYYTFYEQDEFKTEFKKARELARVYRDVELTAWDFKTEGGFNKCGAPWSAYYISWDGQLPPCCAKPFPKELNFGDVFEDGLMASLNSPAFREFRELWFKNETPSFCEKCHLVDLPSINI